MRRVRCRSHSLSGAFVQAAYARARGSCSRSDGARTALPDDQISQHSAISKKVLQQSAPEVSRYKLAQTSAAPRGGGCPRTPACALSLFFSPGHRVKSRADKGRPWTSLAKIKAFHKGPPLHGTARNSDTERAFSYHPNNSNSACFAAFSKLLSAASLRIHQPWTPAQGVATPAAATRTGYKLTTCGTRPNEAGECYVEPVRTDHW